MALLCALAAVLRVAQSAQGAEAPGTLLLEVDTSSYEPLEARDGTELEPLEALAS